MTKRRTLTPQQQEDRARAREEQLAKDADNRPLTVGEFKQILEAVMGKVAEQELRILYAMRTVPLTRHSKPTSAILIPGEPAEKTVTLTLMQWYQRERQAFIGLLEAENERHEKIQAAIRAGQADATASTSDGFTQTETRSAPLPFGPLKSAVKH